ncbi:GNAT family N-acetyltransferase [Natronorubrum bangense]|uniref:N-acetyltransferase GCN5 n=2 Tax=Natronorubrum bangense TaxID=61858 RepID=L9WEW2_9EURY|nr:GNAT family N-acetyltransferase [Natronorubrum bangense]ELY48015.1 N-acetyltransferase GCN5 [Natronorubrum bangense JCM 10635]QCC53527.1 N-acetyltransferase [Natronorubrum bangense]
MEIREATAADIDAIRSIAHRSLSSTYTDFLEEATIENAVEQWYGDSFADELDDDHTLVLALERDGDTVGFSQSDLVGQRYDTGRILWLHIDPDHRGGGTGVRLLVRTREKLLDEGADKIQGLVLEDNEGGNEFYQDHGFEQAGQREVEIGKKTFTENVYAESEMDKDGWGAVDELDVDGETIYVSYGEASRGAKAPFYSAYKNEDRSERYALLCGNCNSIDNAMDAMGRVECNACGNRRKATRWDSSYL